MSRALVSLLLLVACGGDGADGGPTDADTGTDDTTPANDLCGAPFAFSDPGAAEHLQWVVDGAEHTSLPPSGGAYVFNTFFNVVLYSSDLASSLSFGSSAAIPDGLPAGTYTCADGAFVNGGPLGMAQSTAPGSDCVITFDEAVSDGGVNVGHLSAQLVDLFGAPTTCVQARFSLTDAPP
jgi:hypothetical protein